MAKKVKEIVEKNEIYYQNYVIGRGKSFHMKISITLIIITALICWGISCVFKRMNFIKQAGTMELEGQEVMTWVEKQMQLTFVDSWLIAILGVTIVLIIFIIWVYKKIKGYNLYKMKWVRIVPVAVLAIWFLAISIIFLLEKNGITMVMMLINGFQFASCFKVLLPLELREAYEGIAPAIEWATKKLIKNF